MKTFPIVRFSEVLRRVDRFEPRNDLIDYQFAGTYSFARGIFRGGRKLGSTFSLPKIQRIRSEDFVYCKIMAWEGAFGVVPPDCDNCVMSGAFVVYEIDRLQVDPRYLNYFFKVPAHWQTIGRQSTGTNVRRRSLHPNQLEAAMFPLPPLSEQQRIVAKIDKLVARIREACILCQQTTHETDALMASKLKAVITECGNKVRYVPFSEIAKLERRPVPVAIDQQYQEIGVYSFGKGIFHKPPRTGAEVGDKDLYEIRASDLILQITFAWEGAVALAGPKDDQLYGSVRYLTFRVNEEICSPRYLLAYLRTAEAINQLGKISPGSAGRNRVLSVKRLSEVIVPVVPREFQKWLTDELNSKIESVMLQKSETATELNALLASILDKAFKGEL